MLIDLQIFITMEKKMEKKKDGKKKDEKKKKMEKKKEGEKIQYFITLLLFIT